MTGLGLRGPRRHRGGPKGHVGAACPRRISRFLEPCLLLLLREGSSHGYDLVDGLGRFGFRTDTLDASVVYRVLRAMEEQGWVASQWETSASGPARRVYSVTRSGEEHLNHWIDDLRRTRDEIDRLIAIHRRQDETTAERSSGPSVSTVDP